MHFDLNELFEEVIRKVFEYNGTPLSDEEIEKLQIKLSLDEEFCEYVKSCVRFDDIAIRRYKYEQ